MSVEQGIIEYIFDTRGADAVRQEFDSIADAVQAGEARFSQLDKVIASVEGRAPRLAASLRRTRTELEAIAKADAQKRLADAARPDMYRAAADAGNAQADRDRRRRIEEIGKEEHAREQLARAIQRENQARATIRRIGNPGDDAAKVQQLTRAHRDLAGAIKQGESAQRSLAAATETSNRGIISQRYAYYDIANLYGVVGTAMAGAGIYATVVGAQFQSAFTQVERTLDPMDSTAESVDNIRRSLVQLQGQIPLTFAELSQIATIGNQMGIAEEDLLDFTGTIARFASVSGMSIEEVSKSFGGFMAQTGLAPEYLENLGSSLALVSINSNATESEILSVSKEIAALSNNSGLAADQIVGLAGTFASLRIQPERARGSLGTYFGTLRKAVAEGGDDLQNFATVVGVTADELDKMVRNGQGADVLRGFLTNLNSTDAIGVTQALDDLGLAQLRVEDTFIRLSNGLGIYNEQMRNAQTGFVQGAELNRQYSQTVDDLAAQFSILVNGLNSLVATASGGAVDGLAGLLMMVNRLIFAFQDWLERHPWARYLILFTGALVTVVGVMGLFRMVVFRANAAVLAFRVAALEAGKAGITASTGIRGLAGSLITAGRAGSVGAQGLRIFRNALVSTGIGAIAVGIGALADKFMGTANGADDAALSMQEYNDMVEQAQGVSSGTADEAGNLADQLGGGGGGGAPSVADAAEEAAEKVRLLTDYASDLSGVLARSFSIRFDSESAMDRVTTKWNDLREEAEKYRQEINTLTADRSLKKYWLSIAEAYNDQLRAGQLRAEIADIDADLAKAQRGASNELKGHSDAAIDNRETMRTLTEDYRGYIEALAESGASQEYIQKEIKRVKDEFYKQGTALGFTRDELDKYGVAFDDMATIVTGVPRDVTVEFNGDPALQALAEFNAKLEEQARAGGEAAGAGAGEGFGGGLGGAMPTDFPLPDFTDEVEEWAGATGRGAGDNWAESFLNAIQDFGNDAAKVIADIAVGIMKPFDGLFGFDIGEFETNTRNMFGRAGWLGSKAFDAEFETGMKQGQALINGVNYQWDFAKGEYHRIGAIGADEFGTGYTEGDKAGTYLKEGLLYERDGITGEFYLLGQDSGVNYTSGLDSFTDPAGQIRAKIAAGREITNTEAIVLAKANGLNYDSAIEGNTDPINKILLKLKNGKSITNAEAQTLAAVNGAEYNTSLGNNLDPAGQIESGFSGASSRINAAARESGRSAGSTWWDEFKSFWNFEWLTNPSGAAADAPNVPTGRFGRFAGGGYTGSGHWLQPAGIVHRGEYVVPKKHVDQRTGLPDLGYVQSLRQGKAAPKAGYATGGFATGGGAIPVSVVGPVDLGARSLHEIANSRGGGFANMPDRMIGEAAARSYRKDSLVGAR